MPFSLPETTGLVPWIRTQCSRSSSTVECLYQIAVTQRLSFTYEELSTACYAAAQRGDLNAHELMGLTGFKVSV